MWCNLLNLDIYITGIQLSLSLFLLPELKEAHADISEELTSLRSYLERLLSTIITNKPELLELAKE